MAEVAPPKKGRLRKPLKTLSTNDANISAGKSSAAAFPLPHLADAEKENREGLSLLLSPKKTKKTTSKPKALSGAAGEKTFADELREMQEKMEQMKLEKEKTEELLKEKDALLRLKEEELEGKGKEEEKLRKELKKLQKLKQFEPTVSFPLVKSMREKEEGEEEKKTKKKNKKDKNGLERKKPCAAYVSWCKDQWNEIKKERPEAEFKEISNILGAKWKGLSAEQKKPYEERYQKEKEDYLKVVGQEKRENEAMKLLEEEQIQKTAMELLEQYLQFKQEADKEEKKTKKEKDPMKPKHPMSAFFLYSKQRRASLIKENKNVLEIAKIAGQEWRNMTEEERTPYEEIARKQKEEYSQQIMIYKQKKLEEAATLEKQEEEQKKVLKQEALQLLKKKEKSENIIKKCKENQQKKKKGKEEKNSDPNKPKKPATSFLLFSKENRKALLEERPGINNSTLSAMLSVKWKELSEAERKVWNDKAAEGMAAYKREMEEYNKSVGTGDRAIPKDG